MRRATQKSTATVPPLSRTPSYSKPALATIDASLDAGYAPPRESFAGTAAKTAGATPERKRHLEIAIRQRIESRLPGRVRNLVVRVLDDTVVLEGQCATYYTKQLAQHAALGILEDEHLENALVVNVPR